MKIAIAGKGGVGKTTISGTLCRVLGKNGNPVLAIDGDPNPNLSVVLGIDKEAEMPKALSTDIIERIEESEGKWKFQVHSTNSSVLFCLQTAAEADQGKHLQNCRLSVPVQSKILFQNSALMLQYWLFLVEFSGFSKLLIYT